MQVTLESKDISEIVDVSIENALVPIRAENRRLRSIIEQLQGREYVSVQDHQSFRDQTTSGLEGIIERVDLISRNLDDRDVVIVDNIKKIARDVVKEEIPVVKDGVDG